MKAFELNLFEGHPIIEDGDNIILIDTGAPSTIHSSDELNFCSGRHRCSHSYMGVTVSKLSEMLGTEITTLLGADILRQYRVMFDYNKKRVEFSEQDIPFEGSEVKISNFMGIPVIELSIKNQYLKFFLDTGAKLSYLSDSITSGYESICTEEDFYPGAGKFETSCFEIPTRFERNEFKVKYGNLPSILQMTFMLGGTNGIIGYDFFNNFKVLLDLNNESLKYVIHEKESKGFSMKKSKSL